MHDNGLDLPYFLIQISERETVVNRTAEQWWAWHDLDPKRWSPYAHEAEGRCAAWVAGESDDGPQDLQKEAIS